MLNKIGKIGKRNIQANKTLKETFIEKGITRCEKCGSTFVLTFAHRHKRIWYRSKPELLSDFNQVLLLCIHCHTSIEYHKDLSDAVFLEHRGEEKL